MIEETEIKESRENRGSRREIFGSSSRKRRFRAMAFILLAICCTAGAAAGVCLSIEKQKAELQRIEETKRHKEQQVSLAEQELKQVKAEIRTDKLKKTATNAATAIATDPCFCAGTPLFC